MSQAEIAGGQLTATNELPSKGRRLRNFSLYSTNGKEVRLSDYAGQRNLVLIFGDDHPRTAQLLSQLAERYTEIKNWEGEVLAIAAASSRAIGRIELPYSVLLDEGDRIHQQVGASDPEGGSAAAVYITDRFAEVFAFYRTSAGQDLPSVDDIVSWLEFVNSQCPECEPPEWPL